MQTLPTLSLARTRSLSQASALTRLLHEESLTTVMTGALVGGQGSSGSGSLRYTGLDALSRRFLGGSGVGKSSLPMLLVRDVWLPLTDSCGVLNTTLSAEPLLS